MEEKQVRCISLEDSREVFIPLKLANKPGYLVKHKLEVQDFLEDEPVIKGESPLEKAEKRIVELEAIISEKDEEIRLLKEEKQPEEKQKGKPGPKQKQGELEKQDKN